jgi:hypothetical protein
MLYCENANDHGILIRTGRADSVMRPSSTSLAIRLTGPSVAVWRAENRRAGEEADQGRPDRKGTVAHHHLLLLASTAAPSYAAGPRQQSITKWIRPDGGVGKHGSSPSGGDAKETAPRLRLFRTRIVWIALRYHDCVARVRYLLTNALSACGYGQRRRGAPAADASAEALIRCPPACRSGHRGQGESKDSSVICAIRIKLRNFHNGSPTRRAVQLRGLTRPTMPVLAGMAV